MACVATANCISSHLTSITPVVTAALTAVTAVFVALIGLFQYRVNKEKLRLDLYNRRFDIYSRVVDFYQALVVWDASESAKSAHRGFIKSHLESSFLFDPKDGVYILLDEMSNKAFKIIGVKERGAILAQASPEEFIKCSAEMTAALSWFGGDGISRLKQCMSTYLNFHKIAA